MLYLQSLLAALRFELPASHLGVVLIGASVIGGILGGIGAIASLRREALLGDALAHCTLVGVVAAFFWFGQREFSLLFLGACLSSFSGLIIIRALLSVPIIKPDAALAVVLAGFFGFGLIGLRLVQVSSLPNKAGLESFIFGKASLMSGSDVSWAIVVALTVLLAILLTRRSLAALCFDSTGLVAFKPSVARAKFIFAALLLVSVSIALPATGVILTCSLLVIPASIAKFLARSFSKYLLFATALGALSGAIGAVASMYFSNVSTGASVTLTATSLLFLALFLKGFANRGSQSSITRQAQ